MKQKIKQFENSESGQILIQVLIGIGLLGIMVMTFASMMATQSKAIQGQTEKLAANDLQQLLTASLADGSVCGYVLSTAQCPSCTFDSTRPLPQTIHLANPTIASAALYSSMVSPTVHGPVAAQVGTAFSPIAPLMKVSAIDVQLTQKVGNSYLGNWVVSFDNTTMVQTHRPVQVLMNFFVDATAPTTTKFTGCQSASGTGGATTMTALGYQLVQNFCGGGPGPLYCDVQCPAGKVPIGGGGIAWAGNLEVSIPGKIDASTPTIFVAGPYGWAIKAFLQWAGGVSAYVVCAKK